MRRGTTTEWMAGSLAVGLAIVWLTRFLGYPLNDGLRATARALAATASARTGT